MSETRANETHPPRRLGRSIGALLAGMFVGIVLTIGADIVLHVIGVFPPWGQSMVGFDGALLLATVYRTVFGVAGSYIIARLAPNRPMQHALVGGVVGLAVSIVGAAVTWTRGPPSGPTGIPSRSSCSQCRKPGSAASSASCSCTPLRKQAHSLRCDQLLFLAEHKVALPPTQMSRRFRVLIFYGEDRTADVTRN